MRVVVAPDLGGERADKIVAVLCAVSRAESRRWMEAGRVRGRDGPVDPAARLAAGEELVVDRPPPDPGPGPEPLDFTVRYEDESVVVVDKPAGVVVHPGAGHRTGTLVSGLMHRLPELEELGEAERWGLVHRLDRDTSGLLIVARTASARRVLQRALAARTVTREYLALVWGRLPAATGTIDAPLGRDPAHPTRVAVVAGGRPARTHYRRSASWEQVDLATVRLETGRTHQIRVHLASIGHPLVGDPTYGRPGSAPWDPGRTWLHAVRLGFPHPDDDRPVVVTAPLPADLSASRAALGPPAWSDPAWSDPAGPERAT